MAMSNYPDDISQASFDAYWNDKLDYCSKCGADPAGPDCPSCGMDEAVNEDLIEYWQSKSEFNAHD